MHAAKIESKSKSNQIKIKNQILGNPGRNPNTILGNPSELIGNPKKSLNPIGNP